MLRMETKQRCTWFLFAALCLVSICSVVLGFSLRSVGFVIYSQHCAWYLFDCSQFLNLKINCQLGSTKNELEKGGKLYLEVVAVIIATFFPIY